MKKVQKNIVQGVGDVTGMRRRIAELETMKIRLQAEAQIEMAQRIQAQNALRESEKKYRKIFENASEAILVAQEGRWRFANPAAERLFGYPQKVLTATSLGDFIHPTYRKLVLDRHVKRLQGEKPPKLYEFKIMHKDGEPRWVEINVAVFSWNQQPATLCFLADVTQRKQAEEALQRQNRFLSLLHETTLGLINRLEIGELLKTIMDRAALLAGTQHGYFYLREPGQGYMELCVGMGYASHLIGFRIRPGEGLAGRVWETARPMLVNEYQSWPHRISGEHFDAIRGVMGIPLKNEREIAGVIGLAHTDPGKRFGEADVDALGHFAQLAAIVLDNARLYGDLKLSLAERTQTQEALRGAHNELEARVAERTAELRETNRQLKKEVARRKRVATSLRKRERQLQAQSSHLGEVNAALKVLLKQRQEDKKELEENVLSNVKELVMPHLAKLKQSRLSPDQQTHLALLESNLNTITSPFVRKVSSTLLNLTPMEIRVANLVKEGKTNKEIAQLLLLSENTILFHRHNIRVKLGLRHKKINLRSFLLSYEN